MKKKSLTLLNSTVLLAIVALYFTFVLNYAVYHKILSLHPFEGKQADLFLLTIPFFIFFTLNALFQIIALPFIHKIIIPLLIIISAAITYNSVYFDVYFTLNMLENVIQTSIAESSRMITWQYVMWMIVFGIIPAILYILVKIKYRSFIRECAVRIGSIVVSIIVILAIAQLFYKDYAFFFRNNKTVTHLVVPSNFIMASIQKMKKIKNENRVYTQIGLDSKQNKPDQIRHLTIMVVGETTRAQNWGLNNYYRQTTPKLSARGDDIINFNDVTSCGTATAVSVPCMFSNSDRDSYDGTNEKYTDNILDILQRAGIDILWLDNDDGCKSVCDRVPNKNVTELNLSEYCNNGECLDNILLKDLNNIINNLKDDTLIVLHTIGSHGPTYYERYSPEYSQFTPTCDTNQVQTCSMTQIKNTYDNTILYIDQFLDKIIDLLENKNDLESSLLYISDHGESLGENSVYLHGSPYSIAPKEQTQVPMIFWFSKLWKKNEHIDFTCLKNSAKNNKYSHDYIFNTLIGLMDMDLTKSFYNKEKDILTPCRKNK